MYDSRIGRRWERDPVVKVWESSYATFANNPILFADPLGLSVLDKIKMKWNDLTENYEEASREKTKSNYDTYDYEGGILNGMRLNFNKITFSSTWSRGSDNHSQLDMRAISTGLTSNPRPGQHLAFDGRSSNAGAGMGLAGGDISGEHFTFFKSDNNVHTVRSDYNIDYVVANGNNSSEFGTGVGYNYFYGDMINVDPFEDPASRIENSNDMSVNATIVLMQVGYNGGDMNKGGFSYNSVGIGFGAGFKSSVKPTSANLPANMSMSVKRIRVSPKITPSNYDSVKTAQKYRGHSRSPGILKRNGVE